MLQETDFNNILNIYCLYSQRNQHMHKQNKYLLIIAIFTTSIFGVSAQGQTDPQATLRSPFDWAENPSCKGNALCLSGPRTDTGLFANVGAHFFRPLDFAGTPADSVLPGTTWRMLVGQFALSELPGFEDRIPNASEIQAATGASHAAGRLPIGLLAVRYEYLDEKSVSSKGGYFERDSQDRLLYIGPPGANPY